LIFVNQYGKLIDGCQCEVPVVRRVIEVKVESTLDNCCPVSTQMMSEDEAREVALIFDALSDPVRLRIFSIIAAQKDSCSCNLEAPVAKSQPTVSHHTRILAKAGLITGEKRGRWTYWQVVPGRLDLVADLLRSETPRAKR
jgi:ArsR family transcriptional regulator